MRIPITRM